MTVAIIVGRAGIDSLLVVSQVVLSIVLPFITLPLLLLTSSKDVMTVVRAVNEDGLPEATAEQLADVVPQDEKNVETTLQEQVSFANGRIVQAVGWVLWLLVVVANVYVLVQLGLGE
jgi:metal iron transporter